MAKVLIAVKSCHDDLKQGCHNTIRETWGRNVGVADLGFFVGYRSGPNLSIFLLNDEISIPCEDDYDHLPQKTRRILQWSLEQGYDFTFLCDVDTFLEPDRLMKTGFENYDYSGRFGSEPKIGTTFQYKDGRGIRHEHCEVWASGGFGYFLSRKAAKIVTETEPTMWAEDMFVGNTLGKFIRMGEITAADLQHFENEASWHYPAHIRGWCRETMQVWMKEMYLRYKNG